MRAAPPQRECSKSQGARVLPQGQLQGDVPHHRELPVRRAEPPQAADAVDEGALHRGGEAQGAAAGRGGQVQDQEEVPPAEDHLGRGGDELLLQGEEQAGAQGVVQPQSVSESEGEEGAGGGHGADDDAGVQLVQEQEAERQGVGNQQVFNIK